MILKVINIEYIKDYIVKIKFNDNYEKIIDLKNELDGEIFEPLKNIDEFKQFGINCNAISWDNGADIAAEYLYNM